MTQRTKKIIFPLENDIPSEFRILEPIKQNEYLLNGLLKIWTGEFQEVNSPVFINKSGNLQRFTVGTAPSLTIDISLKALAAAKLAYSNGRGTWPTMPVADRIEAVMRFATMLQKQRKKIVTLLMWEIGKSLLESQAEFDRTVAYISETIDALKNLDRVSSRFVIEQGIIGQIRRAPLGVTLCMGPYNFPLYETFSTMIPALIMGNTILLKPPRFGVLLFQPLLEAFHCCFPPGVINTLYGDGEHILPPIMETGDIDVLAFIGTSKVADKLRAHHPRPHRLRCVLGLDAKNPAVILSDADLELTTSECLKGCLTFNGQRCTALKIIFVHTSIADSFLNKLSQLIDRLSFGMPWDNYVTVTPLPEPEKPKFLTELLQDALAHGAKILNHSGGTVSKSFFYPALLYPVTESMRIYHEEQFGPLIPVVPYTNIQEVVDYVVASNYGQQASIFGTDSDNIASLLDALVNQVCRININSQCQRSPDTFPFNGRKTSAEGTQSVVDALRIFSIRTVVATRETAANKDIINNIIKGRKSHFLSTDYLL